MADSLLWREWIDLQAVSEHLAGEVRLPVLQETSRDEPVHPAGGLGDKVTIRDVTLMIGRKNQVLTAIALVGTRRAGVDYESEERIVDCSGAAPSGNLDDGWAVLFQIEKGTDVDGVGIAR